jgi:hypothetical protein
MSMSARQFLLAIAALLTTAARPLSAQSGMRYTVTMSGDKGRPSRAVVTVLGDRSRIQPIRERDETNDGGSNYMIIRDGKLYSIEPDKREYNVNTPEDFENVVGTALRAVSPMVKMHIDDTDISGEELDDADRVLGYSTRHFRLTQKFNLSVSAFGLGAGDQATAHEVVTDYWFAPDAKLPRNPLVELIAAAPSAPAHQSRSFTRQSAKVRESLFTGMPMRIVVRSREGGDTQLEEKARIEITQLERIAVDSKQFEVPVGYTQTEGLRMHMEM